MNANKDRCEVVIVGAGPAGVSCGYVLAKAGMDVVILERGEYPGAKNMFGGVFFADQMNKMLPGFYDEAPIERFLAKRRYSILVDNSEIALGLELAEFKKPPYNHSFIVKRSLFDKWFASKAEELGATILGGVTVGDFLRKNGRISGVTSGPGEDNTLLADVVVCAEGANSILSEKAGLRNRLSMRARSVAVKEVIALPKDVIDERFRLTDREGAAYEYFGDSVSGMLGNGFIYTNRDSLSVGVGVIISELYGREDRVSPNELLERFKSHPCVAPLLRGGETVEYSAHMIPTDGYKNIPQLYADGILLVGDAAGLVDNSIAHHEGVNLAMASGMMAAETILKNREEGRYDAEALSPYAQALKDSFVLANMRGCRSFLDIMHMHKELINEYPQAIKDALVKFFEVSDVPRKRTKRKVFWELQRRISFTNVAKTFVSLLRSGI